MKGSWYETKLQRHCQHLSSDVGKFLLGAWVCLVFVGLWLARSGAEGRRAHGQACAGCVSGSPGWPGWEGGEGPLPDVPQGGC